MKKLFIFALFGLIAVTLTLMPEIAMAQKSGSGSAGSSLLSDVLNMVGGSLGTLVGLGIALLGLYTWLVQQQSWGIIMIIGGVAITAFPSIFKSLQGGFSNAFTNINTTTNTVEP